MADPCGLCLVLVNDVLAAINVATAQAQGEEATVLQRAKEGMEEQSEEGTTVEVHPTKRGRSVWRTSGVPRSRSSCSWNTAPPSHAASSATS